MSSDEFFSGDTELVQLMRRKDWSATPLGAVSTWPQSLRALVRMLLASRHQMWLGWGPDLTFFYNDAYRPTLGAKHPQALGKPFREVWSEVYDNVKDRVQRVVEQGESTWDEGLLLLLERNGYPEETYHTFSYSPVTDDTNRISGLMCVVAEETERRVSERRLASVRELSSGLARTNTMPEVIAAVAAALPIVSRDLPFTLLYVIDDDGTSAALASRTGIPDGHVAAPPVLRFGTDHPWPLPASTADLQPTLVPLAHDGIEWPAGPWATPPSSAMLVPIAARGRPSCAGLLIAALNPHRPFDDAYRSFLDLFARQIGAGIANARAYDDERRRAEALAQLDHAKTTFFSNISHEFRTPLTLMIGPLDELRATAQEPHVREQAALIRRNALRVLRLVNTLLDFSRIEAGRAQARYVATDLAELTRHLVSGFTSATTRAGLRLIVECPPVGEPVYVDREMWEQIVVNLVSNAFKYTFTGEIAVTLSVDGRVVELTVRDTGTGIAAHELPRLFDRFHRVEGAPGRTHEGTGIGLALVKELAALHGGTVAVESELGTGSVFRVRLPLGRAHLPAERINESPVPAADHSRGDAGLSDALDWLVQEPRPSPPAAPNDMDVRVLVADDNADMREYIARLLTPRWPVDTVANGREALEAIRRHRPNLVLSDVMMPELDGLGLLEAIRRDPDTRDLPVVLLSARAGEEAALEGIRAGADDYLVKPFSARDLLARVEAQLLRGHIRQIEETHARRLATVFEQAPVAVALLRGPDHVYEIANPLYLDLAGRRTLVGKPIREALPELEGQGVFELLDQVRQSGQAHVGRGLKVRMKPRDGGDALEDRAFDFVYQPIVDASGSPDGIAVVVYDVTEASRAREEAEHANRAKDEFLAMLGHELRNPLAPILTALHLLRLRGGEAGERERGVIERQVRHLVGLVDDLLDVSRITRGKITIRHQYVSVPEAIASAIETASGLLEQKSHQLKLEIDAEPLGVMGDADRLSQVVANLLTNAAKYTENGGHITVSARREQEMVVLRVRDNGIGIEPEMLPRVFDLFTQGRQSLDRSLGGLGLGLSIVRSLVELHNGSVEARSRGRDRGAEFIVRLPAAAAPQTSVAAPAAVASPGMPPTATSKRVLVVDDNADAVAMLSDALEAMGCRVSTALDGPTALQEAETFGPDIALLDLGLPVMDGFELARRFREHPRLCRTRLVAVTGYGQPRDRERTREAGFSRHLVKPLDLVALRELVEEDTREAHEDPA